MNLLIWSFTLHFIRDIGNVQADRHGDNTAYSEISIRRTGIQQTYTAYSHQLNTMYLSSDTVTETVDKETTMAELNDYITATRKNFVSTNNEGRMVEKCIVEIQGTFLVKIRDDAFNGNDGENAYEHINKFLKIVGPIKINGLTQDRFRLKKGTEKPWSEKGVPYQLCDHICEPYRFKNGGTKWPTCTSDIDGFCNDGELPGMVQVGSMTYFQDHRWYDELVDGKLNDETLALKGKIEGSWGDMTLGVINFCRWLKSFFENFHELEYEVLVKLQECWWKVNVHEIAPFTRMENFKRGPYENIKTEWAINPYLDINFGRFEMMKYSFNDDEEYITIKESEYLKHSKDSLDAYQELLRLIDEGWVVTTPDE
ncbi:hypothetical protein Tco_0267569 [Tanacetum coccineum]